MGHTEVPFFSIIIVTYNAILTLEKCINSVLRQTYRDFEILIIDGASTDNTLALIKGYAKSDARIKYVSEPDKGIYDAMNKGIALAKGDWLYFLGSDDWLADGNVLKDVVAMLNVKNGIGLLYGNVEWTPEGKIYDGVFDERKLLCKNISHQAIFYHNQLFRLFGNYTIAYKTHADWDFNLRVFFKRDIPVYFLNRTIAFFQTGGSSSNSDMHFLRQRLVPLWISHTLKNKRDFNNLFFYDAGWRLLRNAGIKNVNDLAEVNEQIPGVFKLMLKWQKKVSGGLLRNGFVSKVLMFVSYLFYRIGK